MANPKRTIKRDSVFRSTAPEESRQQGIQQGIQRDESVNRQTAIWLSDEELDWLDTNIQKIKKGGWRGATRSALVRALIRAAMDQPLDLTGVTGDAELTQRLASEK